MIARRLAALLVSILLLLGCDENGTPSTPGGGNNQDSTVVLLGLDPADWQCESATINCRRCLIRGSSITVEDSTYLVQTPTRHCVNGGGLCRFRSIRRLDFRPYRAARLRFVARRLTSDEYPRVHVLVFSNVPGTPDLQVVDETVRSPRPDGELAVDVSLENALTYGEATIQLQIDARARGLVESGCVAETEFQVRDFQIVATRR